MGFTKLDSGIIHSSIWAEPLATRVVWIAFLALADRNGFVKSSYSGIQRAANVSPSEAEAAISSLEAPDRDSRSSDYEGRRIEKREGGWQILNYEKYRAWTYSENPEAVRKRERRRRAKVGQTCPDIAGHPRTSAEVSASASASASSFSSRGKKDKIPKIILVLDEEPKHWEGISAELKALWAKSYPGCDIEAVLQEMIAYWDAQPRSQLKLNWKRTIVNRMKWLQDHQTSRRISPRGNAPGTFLKMMQEREAKK